VFTQSSFANSTKTGTMMTGNGMKIVATTT
jgi:hypothetical protein